MTQTVQQELARRILVLDGAMGTQLQERNLTAHDFGGPIYEGCNEHLVLTRPGVIEEIHLAYLEAGADIVETNSFGGTEIVLAEYGLADRAFEINRVAAGIARRACDKVATSGRPRYVAGSMGPTTKSISVTGGVTFQALSDSFRVQALGLLEGGVDLLLLETAQDTLNLKAAADGIARAFGESGSRVPLMISGTIEPTGTMLAGQGVEALYASVAHLEDHLGMISIGLNCATGPEFMTDHLRALSALARCAVSVYPNAGLPDETGNYPETPTSLSAKLARFVDAGWINIIGGCCGTTPAHIEAIASLVAGKPPRVPTVAKRRMVAGTEPLFVEDELRPVLVGERTNVIGSRKFKNLIVEERFEEGSEIARAQVKGGAQVIDVCVANPDRDEACDMARLLDHLPNKVRVPVMIDSTDAAVMELALTRMQGKCILNSINLEDGEARFRLVTPLVRRFGASVVVGCIDDDPQHGMALSARRKLEVARRSYDLLTQKYGISPEDIIFDPLVFPVGTGDENYIGSAAQTIEGVRLISEAYPDCATILGISNVSFGLPQAGREVLNAVFLHHCVKAGLTYAIVNTEKLERYPTLTEDEIRLCDDLIFWRGEDPVAAFAAAFRERAPTVRVPAADLTLDQRLPRYIIEGSKEGLAADLDLALQRGDQPLEIVNGPLMAGMAEVGRLFNDNQLIVAEVLQSAEAMKAAVAHLEPFLEKKDVASKGKLLLATVKGDVHDIGKNLVEIILSNNGFQVVNLGIKVPPETLIAACRSEHPDFIGLSGLLVKSAQQMAVTAADLKAAGIDLPLVVGGAALSARFTDTRIATEYSGAVLYAKDAMSCLDLVNQLADPNRQERLLQENLERREAAEGLAALHKEVPASGSAHRSAVKEDVPLPSPPDFDPHILRDIPISRVLPYLNRQMLYSKHLGLIGVVEKLLAAGDEKAVKLDQTVNLTLERLRDRGLIRPQALYRFYPALAQGNDLILYHPDRSGAEVMRFTFPRQAAGERLCLADFTRPVDAGGMDSVALFVVTCGAGVREEADRLKEAGEYLECHMLQALALELAEATAEFLHQRIRQAWGIIDPPTLGMAEILKGEYQGVRVSFGYPACPDLSDQEKLFALLDPSHIGVQLTEGFMMDPEASVSALVFHHPEGRYFSVTRP